MHKEKNSTEIPNPSMNTMGKKGLQPMVVFAAYAPIGALMPQLVAQEIFVRLNEVFAAGGFSNVSVMCGPAFSIIDRIKKGAIEELADDAKFTQHLADGDDVASHFPNN